jgi:hypothetical protein
MADFSLSSKTLRAVAPSSIAKAALSTSPVIAATKIPGRITLPTIPLPPPTQAPPPTPTPVPVPPPAPVAALPTLPPVPDENPFNHLPFPAPGDRIRADDFRQLSLCLQLVQASTQLSAALFGQTVAAARPFLAAQGRVLARIMSVFGSVLDDPSDTSFDQRVIMMVLPVVIGEPEVQVIVSEAVETRRLAPDLRSNNYAAAEAALRASIGQGTIAASPTRVPSVTNITLADAIASVGGQSTTRRPL